MSKGRERKGWIGGNGKEQRGGEGDGCPFSNSWIRQLLVPCWRRLPRHHVCFPFDAKTMQYCVRCLTFWRLLILIHLSLLDLHSPCLVAEVFCHWKESEKSPINHAVGQCNIGSLNCTVGLRVPLKLTVSLLDMDWSFITDNMPTPTRSKCCFHWTLPVRHDQCWDKYHVWSI